MGERQFTGMKQKVLWDRKFLGKLKDFDSEEERKFEQKHLRAYLKGKQYFKYGKMSQPVPGTGLWQDVDAYYEVKQKVFRKQKL